MTRLESVIHEIERRSPEEQTRLLDRFVRSLRFASDDDDAVGRRGLASLTASTRDEDWSDCYPPDMARSSGDPL